MKWFSRKTIFGCDARGDAESAYFTRTTIIKCRFGQLCLHHFHRSDSIDLHDHPWNFWTLILWRGYIEQTPNGRRRVWPGMILRRRAEHQHRVELVDEKPALTLVWMGRRVRDWGFVTPLGRIEWQRYFRDKGC